MIKNIKNEPDRLNSNFILSTFRNLPSKIKKYFISELKNISKTVDRCSAQLQIGLLIGIFGVLIIIVGLTSGVMLLTIYFVTQNILPYNLVASGSLILMFFGIAALFFANSYIGKSKAILASILPSSINNYQSEKIGVLELDNFNKKPQLECMNAEEEKIQKAAADAYYDLEGGVNKVRDNLLENYNKIRNLFIWIENKIDSISSITEVIKNKPWAVVGVAVAAGAILGSRDTSRLIVTQTLPKLQQNSNFIMANLKQDLKANGIALLSTIFFRSLESLIKKTLASDDKNQRQNF